MDLNQLLSRHQIALMGAEFAASHEARSAHRCAAWDYAVRIREFQREVGAGFRLALPA